MDYPSDIYFSIFRHISHSEFPLIGAYNVSQNARTAIDKLGYNNSNHKFVCMDKIRCCERCKGFFGFACKCRANDEDYDYHITRCSGCKKYVCNGCLDDCGYCSDPMDLKSYFCKDCVIKCPECEEVLCDYCTQGRYTFCEMENCKNKDTPFHEHCFENHIHKYCFKNTNNELREIL